MISHRVIFLFILLLGLLAYANSFVGSFHFDDLPPIVENTQIHNLSNLPEILNASRGLGLATFALNYAVGQGSPFGYHLVNFALHVFNAFLVYLLILSVFTHGSDVNDPLQPQLVAAFAGFVFIVHPIQTQAVSYIIQRYELLASLFYLVGMLLFTAFFRAHTSKRKWGLALAVVTAFMLGLKTKEIVVTLPVALLLYDYAILSRGSFRAMLPRWSLHGVLISIGVVFGVLSLVRFEASGTVIVQGAERIHSASVGFSVQGMTWWDYFLTQGNVLLQYISLLLLPLRQNLDYDFPVAHSLWHSPVAAEGAVFNAPLFPPVVCLLILGTLLIYALLGLKHRYDQVRIRSFCLVMFFLVLAPTSSIVPVVDVINEHRVYLASAFFIVVLVQFLDWVGRVPVPKLLNLLRTKEARDSA